MENIETVARAVENINIDLHEENQAVGALMNDGLNALEVNSNGMSIVVNFLGTRIWFSDEDARAYDEEEDRYTEDIEEFLRKAIREMISILATV